MNQNQIIITDLTGYELWQIEKYGDILPESDQQPDEPHEQWGFFMQLDSILHFSGLYIISTPSYFY
jgi:hypothetical protein